MVRSEVKAFPKYKQEAFKQIHDVVYSILKEGGFFNMYPSLVDDAGISLYYEKQSAKGNSQDVNSRLSGTRYYIASKIGPIKEFTISNRGCEFKSETGNTYTELKR